MSQHHPQLTDAQQALIHDLDDVSEHVGFEFEPRAPESFSTCGFAHIANIDGRSSFVQRCKSLADSDSSYARRDRRNPVSGRVKPVKLMVGALELSLAPSHDGGYRLSIDNVRDFQPGPAHQRLDVRRELHDLVLRRLQSHGYLDNARISTRVD